MKHENRDIIILIIFYLTLSSCYLITTESIRTANIDYNKSSLSKGISQQNVDIENGFYKLDQNDSLIYKQNHTDQFIVKQMRFFENNPIPTDSAIRSFKQFINYSKCTEYFENYQISFNTPEQVFLDEIISINITDFHRTEREWHYDYDIQDWNLIEDVNISDVPEKNFWNEYNERICLDYYDEVINLDISSSGDRYFSYTDYKLSFQDHFFINGKNHLIDVDLYESISSRTGVVSNQIHDIYFEYTTHSTITRQYFVDSSSGFLLKYNLIHSDICNWDNWTQYSEDFGCDVEGYRFVNRIRNSSYTLFECNSGYNSTEDADLPLAIFLETDMNLYDGNDSINIPISLHDSSDNITIQCYVNNELYSSFSNLTSGILNLQINHSSLHKEEYYIIITLVIFDTFNHYSAWFASITDRRVISPPAWDSYLSGCRFYRFAEGYYMFLSYSVYSDTNWTTYIYKKQFDEYNLCGGHWGAFFQIKALTLTNLTAGWHYFTVELIDATGVEDTLDITMHITPQRDSLPPQISIIPTYEQKLKLGEKNNLTIEIFDMNLKDFRITLNQNHLASNESVFAPNVTFDFDLSTLDAGNWLFSVSAEDHFFNSIKVDYLIKVRNPLTRNIIIIISISCISLTNIFLILKRKKLV
ncbi:MAG: hypothetical protein HGN29_09445 [Asgard group archaeon]|nr:hypothetical protein [Asgard group archaeon]